MSLFVIPSSVAKRFEKLERDFLWEGSREERKYHLIKWAIVCFKLKEGGIGIKDLGIFNKAFMGKWLWRFLTEREALWHKVIVSKYGIGSHPWYPNAVRGSYGVSVWKGIWKGWELFKKRISFVIGSGNSVSFWEDIWCGDVELRRAFPLLYSFAADTKVMVSGVLGRNFLESSVSKTCSRLGA